MEAKLMDILTVGIILFVVGITLRFILKRITK